MDELPKLAVDAKQKVAYCIPEWLRNEQIKQAIARPLPRIQGHQELRGEPIALVCYGPSLNETWESIRSFKYVMSCSGAHPFLLERGIVPTWHVEVDPRKHKVELLGPPHKDVKYLPASTCHPAYFDHLAGFDATLWHVFSNEEDALRTLPPGEWALTGGCSVGLRTMTIARFLGFTEQHVFGMDGSARGESSHTDKHPNAAKKFWACEYGGQTYLTTPAMLEAARGTFHELNQMPDVEPTFYGGGLVQAMAKDYRRAPAVGKAKIGFSKPELISAEYLELNQKLHRENLAYGVGGGKHADTVLRLAQNLKSTSVLDYGCGKGYLAKSIPFPIWEYDPAVSGKNESPRPADLMVCTDVLEHIEPDRILFVLDDIRRCTRQLGFFVIHTGPSLKLLADGRNAHILQRDAKWWAKMLSKFFRVGKVIENAPLLYVVVEPQGIKKPQAVLVSVVEPIRPIPEAGQEEARA
jgi:hypothetical protein